LGSGVVVIVDADVVDTDVVDAVSDFGGGDGGPATAVSVAAATVSSKFTPVSLA
jgi:hypothetical protein